PYAFGQIEDIGAIRIDDPEVIAAVRASHLEEQARAVRRPDGMLRLALRRHRNHILDGFHRARIHHNAALSGARQIQDDDTAQFPIAPPFQPPALERQFRAVWRPGDIFRLDAETARPEDRSRLRLVRVVETPDVDAAHHIELLVVSLYLQFGEGAGEAGAV